MKTGYWPFMSVAILLAIPHPAWSGPPFLTDGPEPVDMGHFEFYLFQTLDQSGENTRIQAPAVEFNWGALPDLQLHLLSSLTYFSPGGNLSAYGLGDTEAGIKFRFIQEESSNPQIGIFPVVEIPTGNAARGLGNGVAWVKLPLWIQKSWGPWTTYAGGGYAWNGASGARDYPFGGWLIQRDLGPDFTLGAEIFAQGRDTDADQGFFLANLGGQFNFSKEFSLLFSGGHSIVGDNHTVMYLGLYWTWGPKKKKDE